MAVENQENPGVRRAPLIFVVPACGFVVATHTKQFQLDRSTGEQISCPSAERKEPRSKALIIKPLWIDRKSVV